MLFKRDFFMPQRIQIQLLPEEASSESVIRKEIKNHVRTPNADFEFEIKRRSIDARRYPVKIVLSVDVFIKKKPIQEIFSTNYPNVKNQKCVLIIGAGPAGLFAALELIKLGIKPIVVERGKTVRERRRDVAKINKEHIVNPESNYCFGEGGAGTYSDGKLYTRSKKKGNTLEVLRCLVAHGADEDILINAHPHIGTNKLPRIIEEIRHTILNAGGEILFNSKMTDLVVEENKVKGIKTDKGNELIAESVILATGHSARDVFELLYQKQIEIEAKPFSLGVRIEHPQYLIDQIQYHCDERGEYLPPSSYSLVQQVDGRGVYSFCMCPGGIIAPCATQQEEVVTNGWSPSKRNNPFANSGMVVSVDKTDFGSDHPLAGLKFQKNVEHLAWVAGGKTQVAPAQRMADFTQNKISSTLPINSYQPGVESTDLREILPQSVSYRLQKAFQLFDKKMKGYFTNEAILVAPESRTSSPVRIPRDRVTLEHPQIKGLFPCGEGAGYAGGIMSAAIDGINCARKAAEVI